MCEERLGAVGRDWRLTARDRGWETVDKVEQVLKEKTMKKKAEMKEWKGTAAWVIIAPLHIFSLTLI